MLRAAFRFSEGMVFHTLFDLGLLIKGKAEVYKNVVVAEKQTMNASNPDSFAHNVSGSLDFDNTNIVYQDDAPTDLKVVSWAEGKDFDDNNPRYYAYDKTGGRDSVLYIAENGADLDNEVSALWRCQ